MRRRSGAGWVMLCLIAAAGCASDGSYASLSDEHRYDNPSKALITANAAMDLGYTPRWATDLGLNSRERVEYAAVLDDLLVTITRPGNLLTISSIRDGQTIRIVKVGGELEDLYGPIRWEGMVYVNSNSRIFEIDPRSGETISVSPLSDPVNSGPMLLEDKAVFGSINGTVFAHSLITARSRWRYLMTSGISTPPIAVGANVFAVDGKGTYALLQGSNGDLVWNGRTFGAVTVPPAIDRTAIYIASNDNFLYAVTRAAGEDRWKFPAAQPLRQPPAAIGLAVFLPVAGKGLIALDAVDGRVPRWTLSEPAKPVTARADNLLALSDKQMILIEVDSGRVVKRVPTRPIDRVLLGPDDSLILIARNGQIIRLDPS